MSLTAYLKNIRNNLGMLYRHPIDQLTLEKGALRKVELQETSSKEDVEKIIHHLCVVARMDDPKRHWWIHLEGDEYGSPGFVLNHIHGTKDYLEEKEKRKEITLIVKGRRFKVQDTVIAASSQLIKNLLADTTDEGNEFELVPPFESSQIDNAIIALQTNAVPVHGVVLSEN